MKIKKAALLFVALTLALAVVPMAPAQTSASCEGACGPNEVFFGCPGVTSASACCAAAIQACGTFNGVCSGDAEILCP